MIVYHGFYPADDEARRRPGLDATNREFHHLGYGVLLPHPTQDTTDLAVTTARRTQTRAAARRTHQAVSAQRTRAGYLFICVGPDTVRMFPLDHPAITMLDDQGQTSPAGTHGNIHFANMSPAGWTTTAGGIETQGQSAGAVVLEAAAFVGPGIVIGANGGAIAGSFLGPAGTFLGGLGGAIAGAVVTIAALIVFAIFAAFCAFTGLCPTPQGAQSQGGGPPQNNGGNSYTQSTNVLIPPSVQVPSGPGGGQGPGGPIPAGPTRSFTLDLLPHFPDRNLYGIDAGSGPTYSIVNDTGLQETLAWLGFPGGLGYQFDHTVPGPTDVAGSSLRNYFQLFTDKYLEVEEALTQVSYFA